MNKTRKIDMYLIDNPTKPDGTVDTSKRHWIKINDMYIIGFDPEKMTYYIEGMDIITGIQDDTFSSDPRGEVDKINGKVVWFRSCTPPEQRVIRDYLEERYPSYTMVVNRIDFDKHPQTS